MIGVLFIIALLVGFMMVVEAITFAVSASVFLHLGFWDCYHAAWDRPAMLMLFAIITMLSRVQWSKR